MDQGSLVTEQIDAGEKLAREFDKYAPLQAAFWLKEPEREWYLYLASDQINDTNFDRAYREVHRILGRGPHIWLDPFQVKVRGAQNPLVRDVLELQQKYAAQIPMRVRSRMLGGIYLDDAYIYALPVAIGN